MEPKIEVKTEERGTLGQKHQVFVAECGGAVYEFDPLERALKDCGLTELTEENRRSVAVKLLEHQKVARRRAHVGAVLRWLKDQAVRGIDVPEEDVISAFHAGWQPC